MYIEIKVSHQKYYPFYNKLTEIPMNFIVNKKYKRVKV